MDGAGRERPERGEDGADGWQRAALAATLFAVDPDGLGGVVLRSGPSTARDRWLEGLRAAMPRGAALRRLPLAIDDSTLLGGLDLSATLVAGRPVVEPGLLSRVDGGLLLVPLAERLDPSAAARVVGVLDTREVSLERDGLTARIATRFGIVCFDEGIDDERTPPALTERLAFIVDAGPEQRDDDDAFDAIDVDIAGARARLGAIRCSDEMLTRLCATAAALGVDSLRAPLLALRAARAHAALCAREDVTQDDASVAAQLVLSPRATRVPAPAEPESPEPPRAEDSAQPTQEPAKAGQDPGEESPATDRAGDELTESARAAIPAGLLARLASAEASGRRGGGGRSGGQRSGGLRGRPMAARPGVPRGGSRLDLIATLRSAAPWQRLRNAPMGRAGEQRKIALRPTDLRVRRFRTRARSVTIFALDASGSAALHRLAEAKGAIELLLAECYVRRDEVAVIGFRDRGAQLLLPPTRSLVRCKRSLAEMAGGGGTPLAAGIQAAVSLAHEVRRRESSPLLVLLTDGRANIALDGSPGRARSEQEALATAAQVRIAGIRCLLVDISQRPQSACERLAAALGAHYLFLPLANSVALANAVRGAGQRAG